MSSVILGFQGIDVSAHYDDATKGTLSYVIKDHPINSKRHFELLGLLAHCELRLSTDSGKFTVEVIEKAGEPSGKQE
jgi:hypothetical protein